MRYVGLLVCALLAVLLPLVPGPSAQARTSPPLAAPPTARPAPRAHVPARTLSVAAPWASPSRPTLGQRFVIGGRMPGHVRRPVVLIIDGTRRASGRTGRRGRYRFTLSAPARPTTLRIKVRAPRLRRHRAAVTGIRLVPVVIPVQPCTALPAGTTTWMAGSKRIVNCLLTVPVGSTLKVGAGATVLFGPGAGILVKGRLAVLGTADHPARLVRRTSGRWAGIATAGDATVDITHAVIAGGQTAVDGESSAHDPHGHIDVRDSRFSRCGTGVLVQSSVSTVWTLRASVTGSEFGRVGRGVWITRAIDPVVANNSFHRVSGVPVTITWSRLALGLVHGNSGYDNAENIWVLGEILVSADGTLVGGRADQTPGTAAAPRPLMPVLDLGALLAAPGATVTIAPGVVKARTSGAIVVLGALHVAGTADRPAVLTSADDATVGDLAGSSDGTGLQGWYGIHVSDSGTGGSIDARHLDLRYSALGIAQFSPSGGAVNIADSSFTDNGLTSQGPTVSIERSSFSGPYSDVRIAGAVHPTVRDNSFFDLLNPPVDIVASTLDVDDLGGNSVTDSARRSMEIQGVTIDADGSWPMGPGAWNPAGSPPAAGESVALTTVVASATIASGATVSFGPGAVKFPFGAALDVAGGAVLEGTADQPTVFTGAEDIHVGVPVSLEDYGVSDDLVTVEPGASLSATNTVFRDATHALSLAAGADITLSDVEFANTTKAIDATGTSGCANPFGATAVTGSNVWFGSTGTPGGLSALASATDPGTGDTTYVQAKAAYDDAVARYGGLDSSVSDNTIPFADWACADWSFPVTPVQVDLAQAAPFPAYAQAP